MNNPEIPVGTTVHIEPKDIRWRDNGDLISRSALKKAIKSYADDQYAENEYLGECAIMAIIDNAPTVECVALTEEAYSDLCLRASRETPKGEWKLDSLGAYCSECGTHPDYSSNYCPNCGAYMRGAE